jgi:hypothetical protein
MDFSQRFWRRNRWAGIVDATQVYGDIQHTVNWMTLAVRTEKNFLRDNLDRAEGPAEKMVLHHALRRRDPTSIFLLGASFLRPACERAPFGSLGTTCGLL